MKKLFVFALLVVAFLCTGDKSLASELNTFEVYVQVTDENDGIYTAKEVGNGETVYFDESYVTSVNGALTINDYMVAKIDSITGCLVGVEEIEVERFEYTITDIVKNEWGQGVEFIGESLNLDGTGIYFTSDYSMSVLKKYDVVVVLFDKNNTIDGVLSVYKDFYKSKHSQKRYNNTIFY